GGEKDGGIERLQRGVGIPVSLARLNIEHALLGILQIVAAARQKSFRGASQRGGSSGDWVLPEGGSSRYDQNEQKSRKTRITAHDDILAKGTWNLGQIFGRVTWANISRRRRLRQAQPDYGRHNNGELLRSRFCDLRYRLRRRFWLRAQVVLNQVLPQVFKSFFRGIDNFKQIKIVRRNGAGLDHGLQVEHFVPILAAVNQDQDHLSKLLGLRQG